MWLPLVNALIGLIVIPNVQARDGIDAIIKSELDKSLFTGIKPNSINKAKYTMLKIKSGFKINRTVGLWVVGSKLRSFMDGVVLKVADEMVSPGVQLFEYEDVGVSGILGKLARHPQRVQWPWMDRNGHYVLKHLAESDVQKIGPYPQPDWDMMGKMGIFGAPQLSQSTPCKCAWSPNCKFYYEVQLLSKPKKAQIGWATKAMPTNSRHITVGAQKNSWAADGVRNILLLEGTNETGILSAKWQNHDVIGLAIDIQSGKMMWSLNGFWEHGPEKSFKFDGQLFPCLQIMGRFDMFITKDTWQFAPPEEDYAAWTDAEHFSGQGPDACDIRVKSNGVNDVKVIGEDAQALGVEGDYSFSWDGIGSGEPYYKREGQEESNPMYIYHL